MGEWISPTFCIISDAAHLARMKARTDADCYKATKEAEANAVSLTLSFSFSAVRCYSSNRNFTDFICWIFFPVMSICL